MVKREFARRRADPGGETKALVRRAFLALRAPFHACASPSIATVYALFLSTDDDGIGRRLFAYPRVPESDIREGERSPARVARRRGASPGWPDLEIGGFIGSRTVQFLKNFGAARATSSSSPIRPTALCCGKTPRR